MNRLSFILTIRQQMPSYVVVDFANKLILLLSINALQDNTILFTRLIFINWEIICLWDERQQI